jgi:hypothetical protein
MKKNLDVHVAGPPPPKGDTFRVTFLTKHVSDVHVTGGHEHDAQEPPRGFGWRIHCGVEVTVLSTNKQHTLSLTAADRALSGTSMNTNDFLYTFYFLYSNLPHAIVI